MIRYLASQEIDKSKWDEAVMSDPDFRVYSMSWMLDAVTGGNWSGLCLDDYRAVLPLVTGKKWTFSYCYMPYFFQQHKVSKSLVADFIDAARSSLDYGQLALAGIGHETVVEQCIRSNFELRLDQDYLTLRSLYSNNHKNNLKRFAKGHPQITEGTDIALLEELMRTEKSREFGSKEMNRMLTDISLIYNAASKRGLARLYYAHDAEGVVGGAFFIETSNRLYYLLGISRRKLLYSQSVAYGLLDFVIQKYSGHRLILDFEGSQISSIQYFFQGFGASNVPYTLFKWNDLPFFAKWLKK